MADLFFNIRRRLCADFIQYKRKPIFLHFAVEICIFNEWKFKISYKLHGGGPKRTLLVLSAIFKYFFYAIFLFALSVYAIFYAFSNYTKSDKQ